MLVFVLLGSGGPVAARASAAGVRPRLVTAGPVADASVRAEEPTRRFGRRDVLRVSGGAAGHRSRAFLRFRLTGLQGRVVRSAWLWVHLVGREPWRGLFAGGTDHRGWTERAITWRRRPAVEAATGAAMRVSPGGSRWRKLEVTPLVRQNGTVDIALATARRRWLALSSREAGPRLAPRLRLRVARDSAPRLPVRAAFYTARYPTGWSAGTRYHPQAGRYDGASPPVVAHQLADLAFGRFGAAIVPWSGAGTASDRRDGTLLSLTGVLGSPVRWAFAPTAEVLGDPSPARIAALLAALDERHGRAPAYLRVRGRPVVFVPAGPGDTCASVRRWVEGNATAHLHLVFGAAANRRGCRPAPDDWYPAGSATRYARAGRSVTISPGGAPAGTAPAALPRDLLAFSAAIRRMTASHAGFQLMASYDGWSDGTAVEPAEEWASPSGHGQYLDALHASGVVPKAPPVRVEAAGDIACSAAQQAAEGVTQGTCEQGATAQLAQSLDPDAVLPLGDLQYEQGGIADFRAEYAPSWGRLDAIAHPAPGNHEYCDGRCADPAGAAAAGYFTYFGARAGPPGRGWYSFDLGSWHLVSLDSECAYVGGCGAGSPEETWLRADLAAHPAACTLAYWHRARFTGGHEPEAATMGPVWADLYRAGVELVVNGHEHEYERFLPQSPGRVLDRSGGIIEIVSGTGGRNHVPPTRVRANTAVQNADSFGVTQLEFSPLGFSWRFLSAPGLGTFSDSGSGHCH